MEILGQFSAEIDRREAMANLYEILGVSRGASLAAIRRAFRKKVRSCHPDSGGSVEAFSELKSAYDILSDPGRRHRYDQTGEFGDQTTNDPKQAKLLEILSVALDQALLKMNAARAFRQADVIAVTQEFLAKIRADTENHKKSFEAALDQTRTLENRFRASAGANLMEIAVARRIAACEKQIELLAERIGDIGEALKVLQGTEVDAFLQILGETGPHGGADFSRANVSPLLDIGGLIKFK